MEVMKKSKFCILCVLFVIAADCAALNAQIVLKGRVTAPVEEPVAFATVSLRGMSDTTRLVDAVVTDMRGEYAFGSYVATGINIPASALRSSAIW